jgi:maleate cis-trans isomerase
MYGWKGVVGLVKPTFRPGSLDRFVRLMPDGVCVVPRYVGVSAGTEKEFQEALAIAEERVAELAKLKVDLVVIQGVPPIMLKGFKFDAELIDALQKKYGVAVLTATRTQVDALKALKTKRIVGVTYFKDDLNPQFANFFKQGGFEVAAMKGCIDTPFSDLGKIPAEEIYTKAKKIFIEAGGGDCLYLLGAGWDCLPAIEPLERDLGTTVLSNVPADVWATQKKLNIRAPVKGFGRLLEEMP